MRKTQRKSISKKTRFEIFKRDDFTCQYCGNHPPKAILHIDHIEPVKEGGGNDMHNLITSCDICNLGKSANRLASVPQALEHSARQLQEKEEQLRGWNAVHQEAYERLEAQAWQVANLYLDGRGKPLDNIQRKHFQVIKSCIVRLGLYPCVEAMEVALSKGIYQDLGTFKYFCGVCRNKLGEVQNG